MQLTHLPSTEPLRYDGADTRSFLFEAFERTLPLRRLGVPWDLMPPDLFEAKVFSSFVYGVAREFTVNGAISGGKWRWFPTLGRMATKIGAITLANDLEAAWDDIQLYPEALLDHHDQTDVFPEAAAPPGLAEPASQSDWEKLCYLLDTKWQEAYLRAPITVPIVPAGDSEYALENALAAYLASCTGLIQTVDTEDALEAANEKIAQMLAEAGVALTPNKWPED